MIALNASHISKEEYCLRTFKTWPIDAPVQAKDLAKAGFYYLGDGLEVICFSCSGTISDWNLNEYIMLKHKEKYPNCKFINDITNNIEIQVPAASSPPTLPPPPLPTPTSTPTPSPLPSQEVMLHSTPEKGIKYPVFSHLSNEKNRRLTFNSCTKYIIRKIGPKNFASAGFFYRGFSDEVQCFYCAGSLNSWKIEDDPWFEHARWYPECEFLKKEFKKRISHKQIIKISTSAILAAVFLLLVASTDDVLYLQMFSYLLPLLIFLFIYV